jgi:hypothetical protein
MLYRNAFMGLAIAVTLNFAATLAHGAQPRPAAPPADASMSQPRAQQTAVPNRPNTTARNRTRVAVRNTVPPAAEANPQPDCSQLRGLEKSECQRRDTSRDDLPAGVTPSRQPKPRQQPQ